MSPTRVLITILILYIAGFLLHTAVLGKTVYGDGIFYYSWVRSVVIDHDINFANEYRYFSVWQPPTGAGLPGNKYAIGPALLWTPIFLAIHTLRRGTGYELPYQLAVGLTSTLAACTGLLLLYRLLTKYFGTRTSSVAVASIAGATNLFFYGSVDPVNSHAFSFLAATVFLFLVLQPKKQWIVIGISLGILGLMRPQDVVYGVLLLPTLVPEILHSRSGGTLTSGVSKIGIALIGFLLAFSPQLIAWYSLYGSVANPYFAGGEGFSLLQPHILGVLFSLSNGLFLWTPITMVGALGLFGKHEHSKMFLLAFVIQLYLVASWSTWWQGASYSGRMLVSSLPLLAFGLGHIFQWLFTVGWRWQQYVLTIIAPLTIINICLIIVFLASH